MASGKPPTGYGQPRWTLRPLPVAGQTYGPTISASAPPRCVIFA